MRKRLLLDLLFAVLILSCLAASQHAQGDEDSSTATITVGPVSGSSTVTPGGTQNPFHVCFIVTSMKDVPLENASVKLYGKAVEELVAESMTDTMGSTEVALAPGEYVFVVGWRSFNYSGSFLHVEEETVRVRLNIEKPGQSWQTFLFVGVVGAVIVAGSSMAMRSRRQKQKGRHRTKGVTRREKPKMPEKHKIKYPDYVGY